MPITSFEELKNEGSEVLFINRNKKVVNGIIRIFWMKDKNHHVAYVPSFNASGYGKTIEDANEMLGEVLDDYFSALLSLKPSKMISELGSHGWDQGLFAKRFLNTTYIDKNGVLKNFELPKDTPVEEQLVTVG